MLQVLDQLWKDHIATLDLMRHTIVLRAYGQKDPLIEYKKEAFNLFAEMLDQLREKVTFLLCRAIIQTEAAESWQNAPHAPQKLETVHEQPQTFVGSPSAEDEPEQSKQPFAYGQQPFDKNNPETWGKISRNDPCPCGSGKKYKHCHGKI